MNQEKAKQNYPTSSKRAQKYMMRYYKSDKMDLDDNTFLASQNLRIYKDSRALIGYYNEEDD